jgi:hypothetical protein
MEFDNSSVFIITRHWNLFTEVFHCISGISAERYLVLASHKASSNVGRGERCHSRALLSSLSLCFCGRFQWRTVR